MQVQQLLRVQLLCLYLQVWDQLPVWPLLVCTSGRHRLGEEEGKGRVRSLSAREFEYRRHRTRSRGTSGCRSSSAQTTTTLYGALYLALTVSTVWHSGDEGTTTTWRRDEQTSPLSEGSCATK
ncbi:hypothetical protein K474DRAFT_133793 [Panus rudis PR-1116 ss-1]|nr:hypothetical protein K474DRAFT_133793 [Panus rudis PR-1116 ss-1]